MSREKLLNTQSESEESEESERNFNALYEKGLERIAKMQNLSQNELEQVTKMQNQSRDELEQITKMRRIKNYKNISKEGLLIALLKSEQSRAKHDNKVEKNEEYPDQYDPDYEGV